MYETRWRISKTVLRTKSETLMTNILRWKAISSSTSLRWNRAFDYSFRALILVYGFGHERRRLWFDVGLELDVVLEY